MSVLRNSSVSLPLLLSLAVGLSHCSRSSGSSKSSGEEADDKTISADVQSRIDEWKKGLVRTCAVEAIFPEARRGDDAKGPGSSTQGLSGVDLAALKTAMGDSPFAVGKTHVVGFAPSVLSAGSGTTVWSHRVTINGVSQAIQASSNLSGGVCTVSINGKEVFKGPLAQKIQVAWALPKAGLDLSKIAVTDGAISDSGDNTRMRTQFAFASLLEALKKEAAEKGVAEVKSLLGLNDETANTYLFVDSNLSAAMDWASQEAGSLVTNETKKITSMTMLTGKKEAWFGKTWKGELFLRTIDPYDSQNPSHLGAFETENGISNDGKSAQVRIKSDSFRSRAFATLEEGDGCVKARDKQLMKHIKPEPVDTGKYPTFYWEDVLEPCSFLQQNQEGWSKGRRAVLETMGAHMVAHKAAPYGVTDPRPAGTSEAWREHYTTALAEALEASLNLGATFNPTGNATLAANLDSLPEAWQKLSKERKSQLAQEFIRFWTSPLWNLALVDGHESKKATWDTLQAKFPVNFTEALQKILRDFYQLRTLSSAARCASAIDVNVANGILELKNTTAQKSTRSFVEQRSETVFENCLTANQLAAYRQVAPVAARFEEATRAAKEDYETDADLAYVLEKAFESGWAQESFDSLASLAEWVPTTGDASFCKGTTAHIAKCAHLMDVGSVTGEAGYLHPKWKNRYKSLFQSLKSFFEGSAFDSFEFKADIKNAVLSNSPSAIWGRCSDAAYTSKKNELDGVFANWKANSGLGGYEARRVIREQTLPAVLKDCGM